MLSGRFEVIVVVVVISMFVVEVVVMIFSTITESLLGFPTCFLTCCMVFFKFLDKDDAK